MNASLDRQGPARPSQENALLELALTCALLTVTCAVACAVFVRTVTSRAEPSAPSS